MLHSLRAMTTRMLRSSERYTKTDMVYVASGGFWLVVNQLGIGLIALGLSVAFAHFVPKEVYGNYRFLISGFWILTAFSMTGVAPALMRAVARGVRGLYPVAFTESIVWSLPMGIIGLGTALYYFYNANTMLGTGFLAIAVIGPFMQAAYLYGAYQEGSRKFKANAFAGIMLNAVPALLLLAAMPVVQDAAVFMMLYLAANVISGLVISKLAIPKAPEASPEAVQEFKKDSRHFSLVNALGTVAQQMDRIFVFHYLGAIELAVYSFAVALPDQVKSVVGNVEGLAFPKFATQSVRSVLQNIWGRLVLFTIALVAVTVAYVVIAPYVFAILFPTYPEAVWYSQLYALSLIFLGNVLPPTIFQAQAARRELYVFSVVTSLVQIGILVPCILSWGLAGAVIARITARAFNFVFGLGLLAFYGARVNPPHPPGAS